MTIRPISFFCVQRDPDIKTIFSKNDSGQIAVDSTALHEESGYNTVNIFLNTHSNTLITSHVKVGIFILFS